MEATNKLWTTRLPLPVSGLCSHRHRSKVRMESVEQRVGLIQGRAWLVAVAVDLDVYLTKQCGRWLGCKRDMMQKQLPSCCALEDSQNSNWTAESRCVCIYTTTTRRGTANHHAGPMRETPTCCAGRRVAMWPPLCSRACGVVGTANLCSLTSRPKKS
jgi:hypothetical protein